MSEEQINIPTVSASSEVPQLQSSYAEPNSESSSFWIWIFLFVFAGLFILGVYYYFLYFYDASSIEDAIEKAIKRFNETTKEEVGVTGATGTHYTEDEDEEEVTFKRVLAKTLDNAINDKDEDDSEKEGFEAMDASLGKYNWSLLDNQTDCNQIIDANMCMSGNIFPSRDICINPKLRTL